MMIDWGAFALSGPAGEETRKRTLQEQPAATCRAGSHFFVALILLGVVTR